MLKSSQWSLYTWADTDDNYGTHTRNGNGNNSQTYMIKSTTNRRVLIFVENRMLSPTKPNKNRIWDMLYATSTQVTTCLYTSTLEFFKCVKKGIKMKT